MNNDHHSEGATAETTLLRAAVSPVNLLSPEGTAARPRSNSEWPVAEPRQRNSELQHLQRITCFYFCLGLNLNVPVAQCWVRMACAYAALGVGYAPDEIAEGLGMTPGDVDKAMRTLTSECLWDAYIEAEIQGLRAAFETYLRENDMRRVDVLRHTDPETGRKQLAAIQEMAEIACEFYGMKPDVLAGRDRTIAIAWVRSVVYWLATKQGYAYWQTGLSMRRDRGTVSKCFKRVEAEVERDPQVKHELTELLAKVRTELSSKPGYMEVAA